MVGTGSFLWGWCIWAINIRGVSLLGKKGGRVVPCRGLEGIEGVLSVEKGV